MKMLKYTRAALNKIIDDLKKAAMIFKVGSLVFFTAYAIYSIVVSIGLLAVNIAVSLMSSGYLIYYLVTYGRDSEEEKKVRKNVKTLFDLSRIFVNAISVSYVIYSAYYMASNFTPVSLMLVALSFVSWVLQLLLYMSAHFLDTRKDLIIAGFYSDVERIKFIGGFIMKKEDSEELISPKNREILEKQIEKDKKRREEKRIENGSDASEEKRGGKRRFRIPKRKKEKSKEQGKLPVSK